MIYVRLMGGLGNQMFQYALARRLALDRDTKLTVDLSYLDNQPAGEVPREFELDCFNIAGTITHQPPENAKRGWRSILSSKPTIFREPSPGYNPEALKVANNTLLVGFWQTEKYFKARQKQIRQDFTFIKMLSDKKQAVAEQIATAGAGSVALQIRRGDYVTHKWSSQFHGLTPLRYYEEAVKIIVKKVKNPTFFVISDDHKWCEKNLKLSYPTVFVEHVPGTGQEDMNLMSQCRHQIIANSSYGWWAAWLNKNPKKIVIAPKIWFKEKKANSQIDIVPSSWLRV